MRTLPQYRCKRGTVGRRPGCAGQQPRPAIVCKNEPAAAYRRTEGSGIDLHAAALAAPEVLPASDWADIHFLRRAAALPKLPTMQESGVKDYDTTLWTGILAPAGTPREIVTKLNAELLVVLAKSEVKEALARQGAEPSPSTPEQFAEKIRAELQVWGTLIKQAGIKVE